MKFARWNPYLRNGGYVIGRRKKEAKLRLLNSKIRKETKQKEKGTLVTLRKKKTSQDEKNTASNKCAEYYETQTKGRVIERR